IHLLFSGSLYDTAPATSASNPQNRWEPRSAVRMGDDRASKTVMARDRIHHTVFVSCTDPATRACRRDRRRTPQWYSPPNHSLPPFSLAPRCSYPTQCNVHSSPPPLFGLPQHSPQAHWVAVRSVADHTALDIYQAPLSKDREADPTRASERMASLISN